MRTWRLYLDLDESGNFDSPRAALLLAAVLVEAPALPQHTTAFPQRLAVNR